MKVLIVAESIDINDSSGSKANVALINNLQRAGFDLKVFHYTRKNIFLKDIDCIEIKEKRRSLFFILSRLERYLRYYTKLQLNKPLENLFGFSFTLFNDRASIVKCLRDQHPYKPDLVITLSKGGSFRPHHALLKIPEWHSIWLAYMHDPYPMHHYPKPYTWTEPGFRQKENFIRKLSMNAAYSAFPSLLLKEWMGRFYPNFLKTGVIIPHQVDHTSFIGIDLPKYFNTKEFTLLHAGNLLGARNPEHLVKAFLKFLEIFPESKKHSKLIFLGGNNERVLNAAKGNRNIIASNSYVDFKITQKMQMNASANIILEARSEFSPFLPGKFPHCVLAGKPIILLGPKISETKRLLGKDYSYWTEIDNVERITEIILSLYKKWDSSNDRLEFNRPDLLEYLGEKKTKNHLGKLN